MEKGLTFFHKGEYDAASEILLEAVMEDAHSYEAMYNLACCYSMLGQKDSALSYLHRSAQMAPQCVDWAKEDREFDPIREDAVFQELLEAHNIDKHEQKEAPHEEPVEEAVVEDDEPDEIDAEEAYEEIEDIGLEEPEEYQPVGGAVAPTQQPIADPAPIPIRKAAKKEPEKPKFPPCASCGGIVTMERRNVHSVVMILILLWIGTMFCISMFLNLWGAVGFPIIMFAFYLLMQNREMWVCQNCGASGTDCGQPPDELKKK
ncbi:MAG: tetratricopeptide repeat protein [Candidatus Hinthialibacter antarcticus]|nr:tetratricopeptide repeat protein [Candidatus Hinthialibacter antarcticus]